MTYKILAIGDTATRTMAEKVLTQKGYQVLTTGDGAEGLGKAVKEAPDLILMDEKLPKVDGHQVLNQLQAGGSTKAIPVIMLSSGSIIESEALAIKAGAQSCIAKSTDSETLLLNIRVAIREGEKNRSEGREESPPDRKPVKTEVQDALAPQAGDHASTQRLVNTGGFLSQLERILDGGITFGSLTLLDGTDGTGKSFFCQHFAYGALQSGHKVAYFTSEQTVDSQAAQFAAMRLEIGGYLQEGQLKILQIPEPSRDGSPGPSLADLTSQIQNLPQEWGFILLDSFTNLALFGEKNSVIPFFTSCKQMCVSGRTIMAVTHPHAFDEGMLMRLRMVCDTSLRFRTADIMGRTVIALDVPRLNKADRSNYKTLFFQVDPEIGLRIVPVSQVKV